MPRVTIHQLRHQCASLLIALGADVKQVQQYMGHSAPSVTLNIYAHLLQKENKELADRLGKLLSSDGEQSGQGDSTVDGQDKEGG